MIYLDASCLIKLLRDEPESAAVRNAVDLEETVIISSLAELETEVELKAAVTGGNIRVSQWRKYQAKLSALRNFDPFRFQHLPASIISTALRQHRQGQAPHCRTLDRLHLAAMEELNVARLMSLDYQQAKAAKAFNYEVISPR